MMTGGFIFLHWLKYWNILQVRIGKNGVEEILGLGSLSDFEQEGLEKLKSELKSSIEKGIKFASQ